MFLLLSIDKEAPTRMQPQDGDQSSATYNGTAARRKTMPPMAFQNEIAEFRNPKGISGVTRTGHSQVFNAELILSGYDSFLLILSV